MTIDEFRTYLRNLQQNPYQWPNDYFAWEKPDGSLFLIGIKSTQMYQLIKHEMNGDWLQNKRRAELGLPMEYGCVLYGISPNISYMQGRSDGPAIPYDPVEKLVQEVASFRYLGSWRDPDILIEDRYSYGKVLACGRWELAKKHILEQEKKPLLSDLISKAQEKTSESTQTSPKDKIQNHPKKVSGDLTYN